MGFTTGNIGPNSIFNLISIQNGAHFYVCGDASQMAGDVHKVLIEIVSKYGNMTAEQAEKYMDDLDKSERYQRDVWIS